MFILLLAWMTWISYAKGRTVIENKFLLGNEGWCVKQSIEGVKCKISKHHESNTGIMNYYISGKDTLINVDWKNKDDKDLWYFIAPWRNLSNISDKESYAITFSLTSFMGNFKKLNKVDRAIVMKSNTMEMYLSVYPEYDGRSQTYWIPMNEDRVRKKDCDGGFSKVSDREIKKMLRELTEFAILGDWTQGVEMVSLDNVAIVSM